MRSILFAVAVIASTPGAIAQPADTDGTAQLSGSAGGYFTPAGVVAPITKEQMREAIVALMADGKISTAEQDFLREIAAQSPFSLTIEGQSAPLRVPAVGDEAASLAKLLLNPPNMHTLWHGDPEKTEQLVEISRWGPAAQSRVTTFFGNKLYDAWQLSNVLNAYSPFVGALGQEWNAMKALGDATSAREGRLLLIAGCEYVKQKVTAEGKVPPQHFLCAWMPDSL